MEKWKRIQPKVYWMALAFCLATAGMTALAGYYQLCTSKDDHGICSNLENCGNQSCTKTVTPKQYCRDNLWYCNSTGGTGMVTQRKYAGNCELIKSRRGGKWMCRCQGNMLIEERKVSAICS